MPERAHRINLAGGPAEREREVNGHAWLAFVAVSALMSLIPGVTSIFGYAVGSSELGRFWKATAAQISTARHAAPPAVKWTL